MHIKEQLQLLQDTQDKINRMLDTSDPDLQREVQKRNDVMALLSGAGYRVHWLSYESSWSISLKRNGKAEDHVG